MLEAEEAERGDREGEELAPFDGEAEPAGCERAQEMAVREKGDVPRMAEQRLEGPVGPERHFLRRLSAGGSIGKEVPLRVGFGDFASGLSFVMAVVPFPGVRLAFRRWAKGAESASFGRSFQGAREHGVEADRF